MSSNDAENTTESDQDSPETDMTDPENFGSLTIEDPAGDDEPTDTVEDADGSSDRASE